MADVKRRPYRTTIRRGDAPALICAAAYRLFSDKGYLATSIEDIAAEAGVARPTIFTAVGPKSTILRLVVDQALAGDDAPVPIAQRPWWREAIDEPDPVRSIQLHARNMCLINQRAAPVLRALETAASVDAEAGEVWDRFQRQRHDGLNEFAVALTPQDGPPALRRRHHHRHPVDAHPRRLPPARPRRRLAARALPGLAHRRPPPPLPRLNTTIAATTCQRRRDRRHTAAADTAAPGPLSARPRVLIGAASHARTGRGAHVRSDGWSEPTSARWSRGSSAYQLVVAGSSCWTSAVFNHFS